jgi:outer membrane protein assembly factor BamB
MAGQTASTEWHQWRGANRDGKSLETGLLKQWPAGGPALVWKATGMGLGYSGPALTGNRIYCMGDGPDGCEAYALDVATGKRAWTAKVGRPGECGGFVGPRATPTVDGQAVYVLGQFGDLVCLNAATGQEGWRKSLTKDFGGGVPGWGYSESPLVDGPLVVCAPGGAKGTVVALNKQTGAVVWQSAGYKDGAHYTSIVAADIGNTHQYIHFSSASLVGLGATDGKVLWRAARAGKTAIVPTPIYADGQVFVTSGYGVGHNSFKIAGAGGQFTATPAYEGREFANHHGGVILHEGHLHGHSDAGGWMCMEFKTGKIAWQNRGVGKGAIGFADGHFYMRSEGGKGTVALVEASPAAYTEKGRFDQPDRSNKNSWPHPVIAGGKLYLRDQDVLLCYDVKGK